MDNVRMISETGAIPENAVLIDLREREDYEAGHIPGAQLIPMGMLREEIRRIARFNTPILLYCYNGKKSGQAAELLQSRGYVNARNLGGINAYTGRLEPELTIREIREKKGLSQAALAKMVNMNRSILSRLEAENYTPTVDQLLALSEVLDFPVTVGISFLFSKPIKLFLLTIFLLLLLF